MRCSQDDELAAMADQVATEGEDPCQGDSDYEKATFGDDGYACEAGELSHLCRATGRARRERVC
eukprot:483039-Rhodomonas_salina.2